MERNGLRDEPRGRERRYQVRPKLGVLGPAGLEWLKGDPDTSGGPRVALLAPAKAAQARNPPPPLLLPLPVSLLYTHSLIHFRGGWAGRRLRRIVVCSARAASSGRPPRSSSMPTWWNARGR